jgi:multidrug efflux pump subunit AcrA (membrane-fusion protein)
MRTERNTVEADLILDELDRLSRVSNDNVGFWDLLLSSACSVLGVSDAAILVPIGDQWGVAARRGGWRETDLKPFESFGTQERNEPSGRFGERGDTSWLAVPMEPGQTVSAYLWFGSDQRWSVDELKHGQIVAQAFAEIGAQREMLQRHRNQRRVWDQLESGTRALIDAPTRDSLDQTLVRVVLLSCDATRVSLVRWVSGTQEEASVLATSGTVHLDASSSTLRAIAGEVQRVADQGRPFLAGQQCAHDAKELFDCFLAFPWTKESWLLIEWPDRATASIQLPMLGPHLAPIQNIYRQQQRWLNVPEVTREKAKANSNAWNLLTSRRWRRWGWVAGSLIGLIALLIPYPMTIEADAILEPSLRRFVHATADGVLLELMVDDGDRVQAGAPLAKLRSPSLELQLETTIGEMQAVVEKRKGLTIAINQLQSGSRDVESSQTRLATDLLVSETQENHLRERLDFLRREKERLTLTSLISGLVVAPRARQELENRPLQRGDPLFEVADLDGQWQLRIKIADRDVAYVDEYYSHGDRQVEYVFDSIPDKRFHATVIRMANSIENPSGTGSYRLAEAAVDREDAANARMGAVARVRFRCGTQPLWFVWCRPLVEFVQKRIPGISPVRPSSKGIS